jgi:HEAT repeat protein
MKEINYDVGEIERLLSLLPDASVHARKDIIASLSKFPTPKVISGLIETFRYEVTDIERDIEAWQIAAVTLAGMEMHSVDNLIAALSDDHPNVRSWSAVALGRLGNKISVEPLLECLHDEDTQVRLDAIEALGEIGEQRTIEPLIPHLNAESEMERVYTIRALGRLGGSIANEVITQTLTNEHGDVRRAAISALGHIGDEQSLQILITELSSENVEIRCVAALALGTLGDERALPALRKALEEDIGRTKAGNLVRDYAAHSIRQLLKENAK